MQIASLVLGIFGLMFSWIPLFGLFPPLLGLILGIVGLREAKEKQESIGLGVAGSALSLVALLAGAAVLLLIVFGGSSEESTVISTDSSQSPSAPADAVVTDGPLSFITTGFGCVAATAVADQAVCTLEFTVTVSASAPAEIILSHQYQLLIGQEAVDLASADVDPAAGVISPHERTYSPETGVGTCLLEFIPPGGSQTCTAVYNVPLTVELQQIKYRAEGLSAGQIVSLPLFDWPGAIDSGSTSPANN